MSNHLNIANKNIENLKEFLKTNKEFKYELQGSYIIITKNDKLIKEISAFEVLNIKETLNTIIKAN